MTPDSTGKNNSTTILGHLSALMATSATERLRLSFLEPLAGAVAAFFDIGIAALRAAKAGGRNRTSRYQLALGQAEVQG
jgi:hypothetical protein